MERRSRRRWISYGLGFRAERQMVVFWARLRRTSEAEKSKK